MTDAPATTLAKLRGVYEEAGFSGTNWRLFSYAYKKFLRPLLPVVGRQKLAGIEVNVKRRIGDNYILPKLFSPESNSDQADYEEKLVWALRKHVRPSDNVVVIGGGFGVTASLAAKIADCGTVTCFEGDALSADRVRETAELNGVSGRLTVHHAIVARNIGVYGTNPAERVVNPEDLPLADVLELDCEGAEIEIINGLVCLPRVVICETHGFLGAKSAVVGELLRSKGYTVEDLGWAEPRLVELCETNDVRVLVSTLPGLVGARSEHSI